MEPGAFYFRPSLGRLLFSPPRPERGYTAAVSEAATPGGRRHIRLVFALVIARFGVDLSRKDTPAQNAGPIR